MEQELYNKIFLDLLLDIKASQMTLEKIYLEQLSETTQMELKAIFDIRNREKEAAMKLIKDSLFAKYTGLHPELLNLLWS